MSESWTCKLLIISFLCGRDAAQQLLDFVAEHCPSAEVAPVVIAHNGKRFDVPFLAMELKRVGIKMPANWYFLDTLYLARKLISKDVLATHDQVCSSLQASG